MAFSKKHSEISAGENRSLHFFKLKNSITRFSVGKWDVCETSAHLLISNIAIKHIEECISFFNIYTDASVTLSINGIIPFRDLLHKKLAPYITSWCCDDTYEVAFKLPGDEGNLNATLNIIFEAYHFPLELENIIREKFNLPSEVPGWVTSVLMEL